MSGKAKEDRDLGEIDLIMALEGLRSANGVTPLNKRVLRNGMGKVEQSMEKLKKLHSEFCRKSQLSPCSSESLEFLREKGKMYNEVMEAARVLVEEGEDTKGKKAKEKLENQLQQLKIDVEGKLSYLEGVKTADLNSERYARAMDNMEKGEDKLRRYMECNDKLLDCLEEEEDKKSQLEAAQLFYKTSRLKLDSYSGALDSKIVIKEEPTVQNTGSSGEVARASQTSSGRQHIKIKPMDPPSWDGKYRSFSRFKKLWDENIASKVEDGAQHLLLCQSLPKHILDNISTISDSAQDIWKFLDEKYGRSETVAREVMGELMALDSSRLGKQFMIKFCVMLLDTHSCLTAIGEEDWLVSNRSVAELEDKLPREEKVEWAKKIQTIGGGTKFEKFKNFLLERKHILDTIDTMGSKQADTGGGRCGYCNKPGHVEDKCYRKQREEGGTGGGRDIPRGKGGCAICDSLEHWKNECPDRFTDKDKKAGPGRGRSNNSSQGGGKSGRGQGGGGGAAASVEVDSNTLRALDCARCKASSKLSVCAGCKKTSSINHCLAHCSKFMVLSVEDRVKVVKTSKSCAVCLHPSHTSDKCLSKNKDNYICGIDNCQSHHHPVLHGSSDVFVTSVNVLLRQQSQAVIAASEGAYLPIGDWHERVQYEHDSFPVDDSVIGGVLVCKTGAGDTVHDKRVRELEEVKAELAKPLIHGDKVLMTMMEVDMIHGLDGNISKILGFFDDGSNCSVIKTALARKLGLWGEPVTLELGTVNAKTTMDTKLYCVELLDMEGTRHLIKAFGLDSISGELPTITVDGIKLEFSKAVQKVWDKMDRPTGEVGLLIGSEEAHIHPVQFETVGRMVVKKSIFGSGWVLNGAHDDVVCDPVKFAKNVQIIRSGCYRSNRITVNYSQAAKFSSVEGYEYELSEKLFMAGEALGCEPPRRCPACRGCSECGFRGSNMSQKEALELRMMEDNIHFDESIGKWRVKYPFVKDPRILTNNYRRVLRMMETLERRLDKVDQREAANEVFGKMISNGALEEIDARELQMWSGPVYYLPIQAVFAPKSATTPIRLVTNSSLIDPNTGLSLNSILAKGPMYLNDMWEMLVRFRHQECGLCGDISKAYYQMHTGPVEKHVRRVLWRDGDIGTPWRIFGFKVVSMGDSPAACLMELTRNMTAERAKHVDPIASKKLKKDAFVDDIPTGGTKAECDRFKGREDPDTLACDGTIPEILSFGGYEVKAMCKSGEADGKALEKLGGTVLGLGWSTAEDMLEVRFRVNVSEHKRGKPTGPDLTVETLHLLDSAVVTKRLCLRIVSSQYDPLGIACPLMIILKCSLKELYKMDLSWDQELTGFLRDKWVNFFRMLVESGGIKFRRATRPDNAVGKCWLVCYWDGADPAFGIAAYARWELDTGEVGVRLVGGKSRVAPMLGTSTPRMELEGATLATRVVLRIVHALVDDPPGRIMFLGDSQTILASRERDKGFFGEFFGNRIGETYDNVEKMDNLVSFDTPVQWYYVPSEHNAADRATRLQSLPADLMLGSEWLEGPAYLRSPIEEWPINRKFADKKSGVKIPVEEIRRPYREMLLGKIGKTAVEECKAGWDVGGPGSVDNYVLEHFQFGRSTNDWNKLIRSTSFLFRWLARKRLKSQSLTDGRDLLELDLMTREMAMIFWMRVAMPATNQAAGEGKLKHLSPMKHAKHQDMLVVVGRAVQGLQNLFQRDYLPIILAKTRTAYLVMLWAHSMDHAGVDVTYQTSLQLAWIVGGRALARGIKNTCVRCRYLAKQLQDQLMSVLPPHLSKPCPCFTFVGVDLAGPFICKREGAAYTTRRNPGTMKVWAVLFVCLQVKAVKIYLVGGLNTEDFLLAWDSFVADHGQPQIAYSDRGSNLTAAAREGGDTEVPDYDWDRIAGAGQGRTEWHFHPSGSQFRNGSVEIFVKKMKRTLVHKFSKRLMFILELQTSFKIVASVLNSRPIYARWGPRGGDDPDFLSPLTPNMLLTGRANSEVPVRDYELSDKPLYRLQYVEECLAQWWNQFMAQNFSSLVPRQKWVFERRNMKIGDVVLIQYTGKCRPATYRLGVVVDVEVDGDGLVRTVSVEYSLLAELTWEDRASYKGVTKKRLRLPVQRLVLILPVEESGQVLPGGQAGDNPAPHDEVAQGVVNYGVVWNEVEKKYQWNAEWIVRKQEALARKAHGGVVGDQVQPGVEGAVRGQDQVVGGTSGGACQVVEQLGGGHRECEFQEELRACAAIKGKVSCKDFERGIYEEMCKTLD